MRTAGDNVQILCAKGGPAQSGFKNSQLLSSIRTAVQFKLESLNPSHCYFISTDSLDFLNRNIDAILEIIDGQLIDPSGLFTDHSILVVPRLGTTSAWSTKATEILNRCGFVGIGRIERGTVWDFQCADGISHRQKQHLAQLLHDRMTETALESEHQVESIFKPSDRKKSRIIDVLENGVDALESANQEMGLALTDSELEYLLNWFVLESRNPTETELMMFSQVNSEHCRHKIFNSAWTLDGEDHPRSMFSLIRETHKQNPSETLVAYEDNAAVIAGRKSQLFTPSGASGQYQFSPEEPAHVVFKAETHNHPTAISPFPGAATGAGGEIRDEGATGTGGKPKAGVCGFSVSHLRIPGYSQPWEVSECRPDRIASPLQIMMDGPIGAASFNNEFGRPNIGGYFRTFEISKRTRNSRFGFHKPIMFAGGIGNIRPQHVSKQQLTEGDLLIVIGGPSMLIGLGGGASSSLGQGHSEEELDFASVQRSNPEMQRRCQEVIDRCRELGESNPILSIHDVGAGGLSNALPEIVHAAGCGAEIRLQDIPNDDVGMSPMENWCNEAQERYVLAISQSEHERFAQICMRENCPWQVIGEVVSGARFRVDDSESKRTVVDVSLDFLLGDIQLPKRTDVRKSRMESPKAPDLSYFTACAERILHYPSVADKSFLITIGDRTVSGLVHRDQMVGPWQVPVADAAVTVSGYNTFTGEAMAIGERSPIAVQNAAASARMAIGEALTNLRSVGSLSLSAIRLCANWMASANVEGESSQLYDSVQSVALDMCLGLGLSIPVGKDSMSMSTEWTLNDGQNYRVHAPVSLVATAFCSVEDVRNSLTPQLKRDFDTVLLLVDLGAGKNRMGMSVLHQTHNYIGGAVPDIDDVSILTKFFTSIGELIDTNKIISYHDRSDGGLFATLCEMAFAGRVGLDIRIEKSVVPVTFFFNEELGAVIQVERTQLDQVLKVFEQHGIGDLVWQLGRVTPHDKIKLSVNDLVEFESSRTALHLMWSKLTWKMQSIRDNPEDAQQEYDRILDVDNPGLSFDLATSDLARSGNGSCAEPKSPYVSSGSRPTVAVLREQGVNGHVEMAAAFDRAGFGVVDVVMVDLIEGRVTLSDFSGIVIGGGFSFGDVFGAGRGWASMILQRNQLRDMFEEYFQNTSKFALGVCNGCQVLAELKEIVPGARNWPGFVRNRSEQFEARLVMTEISSGQSILTHGMQGLVLPVVVAHGEGRAKFEIGDHFQRLATGQRVCLQYVDNRKSRTQTYPYNPNGSDGAVAGITNSDGRITAMMPHPERVFRMVQYSWAPNTREDDSPWMGMFRNARKWVS